MTLNKLQELVDQNVPVIANILKFNGDDFYVHSVVVYRLEQNIIYFLDPEDGEKNLDITLFKQLWQRNDYFSIVIKKVE